MGLVERIEKVTEGSGLMVTPRLRFTGSRFKFPLTNKERTQ
jgi:hypothetical protein